ncbi:MAG: 6-phosphogluconolactonase, partial [Rikenellaceae bacterium]|nr:6-phosphogluconolactonase [Rikenellaceae bacterium]
MGTDKYTIQQQGGLVPDAEPDDIIRRYEKTPTMIFPSESEGAQWVAQRIIAGIRAAGAEGRTFVLGLTTGRSPVGIYRRLLEAHKSGTVSFKNVALFSLDEFYPIDAREQQSRNYRIHEELVDHIDIDPKNVHLPDGSVGIDSVSAFCREYECKIEEYGGIDMMLLGTGEQGQLGFNEPGSFENSRTRLVALSNATRKTQSQFFFGAAKTPGKAITMGLGTILDAHEVILVAWGEDKAQIINSVVEGEVSRLIPASYLQRHQNITMVVDEGASAELTRVSTPWLVGTCDWQPKFIRKAVLWLCRKVDKPILKLTYQDYTDNGLAQLLDAAGDYYSVNIRVFNDLQHTITGWPGGKPNADDSTRPETSEPFPKRILIFSPHPDDDVISMGGTFLRLVDQGHDVHVAYQTSGNIAVTDDVVLQTIDTAHQCGYDAESMDEIKRIIAAKKKGDPEPVELRRIKGAIRRGEARAACVSFGLDADTNCHFLDLPFYETGGIKKGQLSGADIDIIVSLL